MKDYFWRNKTFWLMILIILYIGLMLYIRYYHFDWFISHSFMETMHNWKIFRRIQFLGFVLLSGALVYKKPARYLWLLIGISIGYILIEEYDIASFGGQETVWGNFGK